MFHYFSNFPSTISNQDSVCVADKNDHNGSAYLALIAQLSRVILRTSPVDRPARSLGFLVCLRRLNITLNVQTSGQYTGDKKEETEAIMHESGTTVAICAHDHRSISCQHTHSAELPGSV